MIGLVNLAVQRLALTVGRGRRNSRAASHGMACPARQPSAAMLIPASDRPPAAVQVGDGFRRRPSSVRARRSSR